MAREVRTESGGVVETITLPRCEESRNLTRIVAFLSALPKNKAWRVRIDELKGDRTEHQNNALFGCAYPPLCSHLNCTAEQLHEIVCEEFFGKKVLRGKSFPIRTTTKGPDGKRDVISWDVFNLLYAKVQQMGAECGVWVPDPDRQLRSR
jgi:hypothetical protein